MAKIQKQLSLSIGTTVLMVLAFALVQLTGAGTADAARCYEERRRIVNGLAVDVDPLIRLAPSCDYEELQGAGYSMSGLTKPLPSADTTCILWRSISGGSLVKPVVLDCNDPLLTAEGVNTPVEAPDALDESDLEDATSTTGIKGASSAGDKNCSNADGDLTEENCGIIGILNLVFNFVSGGVVLAVIGNIILAGIMYSSAQGDPSATGKAKNRIRSAVIALFMYFSLYGFIQWLIPGGVF